MPLHKNNEICSAVPVYEKRKRDSNKYRKTHIHNHQKLVKISFNYLVIVSP